MAKNYITKTMDREIPKQEIARARRRRILIGSGLCAAFAAGVFIVASTMISSVSREELTFGVVTTGTIEASINSSGTVVPAFEEIITSPISSRIVEVYCKAGDSLSVGTPILRLDLQSAETELRRLSDEMRMKQVELDRQDATGSTSLANIEMQIKVKAMEVDRLKVELANERYLDSLGSGTGDKVREVQLAYNTGCLALEQLRRQFDGEKRTAEADKRVKQLEISIYNNNLLEMQRTLEDARIRAPRTATLTYINDQIGQKVAEGERLAIISDLSHFKIKAQAPDSYAERIRVGAPAVIKTGKKRFRGAVMSVEPQSQNGMVVFDVRIDSIGMSRLRSGLKTDVYVMHDIIEDVVRIPNGAYYKGPGEYELFVLSADGSALSRRTLRLGDSNFEYVEVVSGLQPGQQVVTSDMSDYKTTNKIKIK